jgi:hypothetical protein
MNVASSLSPRLTEHGGEARGGEEDRRRKGEEGRENERDDKRTGRRQGDEMRIHWRKRTSLDPTTITSDAMTDHER